MTELWQNTKQMQQLLIQQQILKQKSKNPKILIRPFNWKSKCSSELTQQINNLSSYYQSESEFWYCISHDLNPFTEEFLCPICKTNRLKFVGRKGSRFNDAYNSTCCNCSANAVEAKKERTRQTISSHSDEFKREIKEKCNQTRLKHFGDPHYGLYGSKSFKQNLKDKYGSETYNNREKCKQTNLERYGVEWNTQLEEFKEHSLATKIEKYGCGNNVEKIKQTCLDKYGVEFYVQSDEFKEKAKNTTIKNYGSIKESYEYRKEKAEETKFLKYGDKYYYNADKVSETRKANGQNFAIDNNATQVKSLIEKYGQGWKSLNIPRLYFHEKAYIENKYIPEIEKYASTSHTSFLSNQEIEMRNYISSIYNDKILLNIRHIISGLELDVYLPDLNLAFEFNGIYWHSINIGKDKYYHINKTKLCKNKGITLIHIFEDLWQTQKDCCKKLIQNAINNTQLNTTQIDGCFYYPQDNYKIKEISEPQAFYFNKSLNRIYVTTENIQDLLDNNYLVCYDCGLIKLERID